MIIIVLRKEKKINYKLNNLVKNVLCLKVRGNDLSRSQMHNDIYSSDFQGPQDIKSGLVLL